MNKSLRIEFVLLCLGTVAVLIWSAWMDAVGGVAIADFNLDTYLHHLDDQQRDGISRVFHAVVRWTALPLAGMNVIWALTVGWYLFRQPKSKPPAGGPDTAG